MGSFISCAPKLLYGMPYFYEIKSLKTIDLFESSLKHNLFGIEQFIGVFAVGIFLAHLIRNSSDFKFDSVIGQTIVWIVSIGLTLFGILWPKDFFKSNHSISETQVYLFCALQKYCFISGWVWLIYICALGKGGMDDN